ncbi:hypothetical protein TNCV_1121141 [Trichonephila clavipes]|uniref:Uncharacterized protein n=1 Tax=Trichonephila clavipes TaxID=2585209 RepID=A0A8X6T0R1_TRICX|nr:hypothetical protein TNCV_1121141 [Trichonephila clavipes]
MLRNDVAQSPRAAEDIHSQNSKICLKGLNPVVLQNFSCCPTVLRRSATFLHLSLTLALSTMQLTVRFSSLPPQCCGGQGLPPLFPFYQPHERTCGLKAV